MATSAFGNLGMQNLGAENYTSGPGMDLGRALLAMGISKSGLEGKLNDFGLSAKNGQIGALPTSNVPLGSVVPAAPSITAPQIQGVGEAGREDPHSEGRSILNNVSQAAPMTTANEQQPMASTAMAPPPSPMMGGVMPPTNMDVMSGPGIRERITKAVGGLFGAA
jgi:hypothetical protein